MKLPASGRKPLDLCDYDSDYDVVIDLIKCIFYI